MSELAKLGSGASSWFVCIDTDAGCRGMSVQHWQGCLHKVDEVYLTPISYVFFSINALVCSWLFHRRFWIRMPFWIECWLQFVGRSCSGWHWFQLDLSSLLTSLKQADLQSAWRRRGRKMRSKDGTKQPAATRIFSAVINLKAQTGI